MRYEVEVAIGEVRSYRITVDASSSNEAMNIADDRIERGELPPAYDSRFEVIDAFLIRRVEA